MMVCLWVPRLTTLKTSAFKYFVEGLFVLSDFQDCSTICILWLSVSSTRAPELGLCIAHAVNNGHTVTAPNE